jgi:hypothetical protein
MEELFSIYLYAFQVVWTSVSEGDAILLTSHFRDVTVDEIWIGEWIDWPLGTTSNCSAAANLHTSEIIDFFLI